MLVRSHEPVELLGPGGEEVRPLDLPVSINFGHECVYSGIHIWPT
jgi:hypothetical protein